MIIIMVQGDDHDDHKNGYNDADEEIYFIGKGERIHSTAGGAQN